MKFNGAKLRLLRERKLMTQEELARQAGIGRSAIATAETGKHVPMVSTLSKLAKVLGVDISELLEEA